MQRVANWTAWIVAILAGVLAVLNWGTLMAPASIDLLLLRVEAPLGALLIALCAVMALLFFVATLRNQVGALLETRKLLKEVQRLQGLADQAEASRIAALQQVMQAEFRKLDERLAALQRPVLPPPAP